MGTFADAAAERLRDDLAARLDSHAWTTERYVGRTPVDVAGDGDPLILVELEWRRADPANNTVTLFRHLADGAFDDRTVRLVQLFTRYYDLQPGGVSSKRENAAFVGERVATTVDGVSYAPLTLDVDPPKRGGDRPDGWEAAVERAADRIEGLVRTGED